MQLPQKKRPGQPILASDWNLLIDALAARTPRPSADLQIVASSGGFTYRSREAPAASSQRIITYPFAEIIRWKENDVAKIGIRGGVIQAGDKVWHVPNKSINLEQTGKSLVWIELEVQACMADGVILPGLVTSWEPSYHYTSASGNYPEQKIPTADEPKVDVIVPIGLLTIENQVATLTPDYYGSVLIAHCPGTIFQHRNGQDYFQ